MIDNPNATISSGPAGDHAIAFAAQRGDERAFGILFERYQHKIFAVALRHTRVPEDAEDIVQQTFQKAFIHLHQFEGKSSFSTWLTRIAVNEALMLLRKGHALRAVPIDDSSENETAHSGPDPETNYLKQEETEALSEAIGKLRVGLRTAIELRELGELSTEETARCMGLAVSTVKARVFRGRKNLRQSLQHLRVAPKRVQRLAIAA